MKRKAIIQFFWHYWLTVGQIQKNYQYLGYVKHLCNNVNSSVIWNIRKRHLENALSMIPIRPLKKYNRSIEQYNLPFWVCEKFRKVMIYKEDMLSQYMSYLYPIHLPIIYICKSTNLKLQVFNYLEMDYLQNCKLLQIELNVQQSVFREIVNKIHCINNGMYWNILSRNVIENTRYTPKNLYMQNINVFSSILVGVNKLKKYLQYDLTEDKEAKALKKQIFTQLVKQFKWRNFFDIKFRYRKVHRVFKLLWFKYLFR